MSFKKGLKSTHKSFLNGDKSTIDQKLFLRPWNSLSYINQILYFSTKSLLETFQKNSLVLSTLKNLYLSIQLTQIKHKSFKSMIGTYISMKGNKSTFQYRHYDVYVTIFICHYNKYILISDILKSNLFNKRFVLYWYITYQCSFFLIHSYFFFLVRQFQC